MNFYYYIYISLIMAVTYEYSGADGITPSRVFISFLLILLINMFIFNNKNKKRIISLYIILTVLSIFNSIKVEFQFSDIGFKDWNLLLAGLPMANLFMDKLPYEKIYTIILIFIINIEIIINFEKIFYKNLKVEKNNNFILEKNNNFKKYFIKIICLFLLLSIISFSNIMGISNSSSLSYFFSSMNIFSKNSDGIKNDKIFDEIINNEMSKKDEDDILLSDYPFNKQKNMDIVIIQSETFFDILKYQDKLGKNGIIINDKDIAKNFRHYQSKGIYGEIIVPSVGGITVNTEYEVLTGYGSKYFEPTTIIFTDVLKNRTNSLAWYFKEIYKNSKVIAIHNHNADYWDRDRVYPLLGIDEFIDETYFTEEQRKDTVGYWMSDKTIFDMTRKKLDENMDKNIFLLSVTVQNHGPFLGKKSDISIDNISSNDKVEIENYVSNLKYSDEELKKFMDYIDSRNKPTMVVFYGDHKPVFTYDIFQDSTYYTENGRRKVFNTNYFIYFNEDVKDNKLLKLKGTEKTISSIALNKYIQMLLGDTSNTSMYIYNYSKDESNYFDSLARSGQKQVLFRSISRELINKYIEYNYIK